MSAFSISTNFTAYSSQSYWRIYPTRNILIEPQRSIWDIVSIWGGTKDEKGLKKCAENGIKKIIKKDLITLKDQVVLSSLLALNLATSYGRLENQKKPTDVLIRDILPIRTFLVSLLVSIGTINNH